jgi:hypothetical protein
MQLSITGLREKFIDTFGSDWRDHCHFNFAARIEAAILSGSDTQRVFNSPCANPYNRSKPQTHHNLSLQRSPQPGGSAGTLGHR